ncbi:MAG: DUF4268 domain-containing protein [Bacteroidia bacterium]
MYTREEASRLRQAFWTAFGQYMLPVLSAEGTKVNWLNYKTGIKDVFFRMHADNKTANISIEIAHKDLEIQEIFFEQFVQLKMVLHDYVGEEWEWQLHTINENGKIVSRIYKDISGVNIFNQQDWPKLISFFKPAIMALDAFWADAKYSFDELK